MQDIIVKGTINFVEPECQQYNKSFVATLSDSAAFSYGNKTCVYIEFPTKTEANRLIDTRYDATLKRTEQGFKSWLRSWFEMNYLKHVLTFE